MATTEALSRELITELARLAADPAHVFVGSSSISGDTITIHSSYGVFGKLADVGLIEVEPVYSTPRGKIVWRLTPKGWQALKEHADAQGDL